MTQYFFLSRVKSQYTESLIGRLCIRPVHTPSLIHRMLCVPGGQRPVILPDIHKASGTIHRFYLLICINYYLSLFIFRIPALVIPFVCILMSHPSGGRHSELGYNYGNAVMEFKHFQICRIGVDITFRILKPEILIFKIVKVTGVIRVSMIGCEMTGYKCIGRPYMLHIHLGTLFEKFRYIIGIYERIGRRPVKERYQPLLFIPCRFVSDYGIAYHCKHRFKCRRIFRSIHILAAVSFMYFMQPVGICDGIAVPVGPQYISQHPGRDIFHIESVTALLIKYQLAFSVYYIHKNICLLYYLFIKIFIFRIYMTVLDIIGNGKAVKKIKRVFIIFIKIIQRIIEVYIHYLIHPYGIGAHFFYLF